MGEAREIDGGYTLKKKPAGKEGVAGAKKGIMMMSLGGSECS